MGQSSRLIDIQAVKTSGKVCLMRKISITGKTYEAGNLCQLAPCKRNCQVCTKRDEIRRKTINFCYRH
jgi:hypothetical protein